MEMEKKDCQIVVRLTKTDRDRLNRMCEERFESQGEVVRQAIRYFDRSGMYYDKCKGFQPLG